MIPSTDDTLLPTRKKLDHRGPPAIDRSSAVYFITVAALERGGKVMTDHVQDILSAARHYQQMGKWFIHLLLVMPDHIHMLVQATSAKALSRIVSEWKHFLSHTESIEFQRDFFDTRIRNQEHFDEKWEYICRNPVARGLVTSPREWPHSIAFDRMTGLERPHR